VTTPMLHHIVKMRNIADGKAPKGHGSEGVSPGGGEGGVTRACAAAWASVEGYYAMLAEAYTALVATGETKGSGPRRLAVDGSGGVGAVHMPKLVAAVNAASVAVGGGEALAVHIVNGVGECALNDGCGAEHVQKGRLPPANVSVELGFGGKRLCSFDGDADRLV